MSAEEITQVVSAAVKAALTETLGPGAIDHKTHIEHHSWVADHKAKWNKIEGVVIGALVVAVLASAAFAFVKGAH